MSAKRVRRALIEMSDAQREKQARKLADGRGEDLAWRFVGGLSTEDVSALRMAMDARLDELAIAEGAYRRSGLDTALCERQKAQLRSLQARLQFTTAEVRG